ncbi:MAG: SurA N-terminal domain-containing protein [Candidatus Tectomicrobia bacterium]|uniref:Periplasmic chaperone PpiD n=1 Tax=Tectimicrobiota bacterium TaxID=2528274 RepID=A0A932GQL1_UNCTE|nr:SurA N-terminal domain-containing protein [Candidatus Tectomicrobia bacterium]
MLNVMRRFAQSWLLKGVLALLALTFISFYAVIDRNQQNASGQVASVNGTKITEREFEESYERLLQFYRQVYQDRLTDEVLKQLNLKEAALESLIVRAVELQAAREAGLSVADPELLSSIQARPEFQIGGQFDSRVYFDVLRNNRLTPQEFERSQHDALLLAKWQTLIEQSALVTEPEARSAFRDLHEKADLAYLSFPAKDYEGKVQVNREKVERYYRAFPEEFRQPEQVRVEYLFWDPRSFERAITVTPLQVEDYYESHEKEFRIPEAVQARHILLRVPEGADAKKEEEARVRARMVGEQLKKGSDFAALARKYSEDPSSSRGGDLGKLRRGESVPEFEKAAFSLKSGQISEPVRTQFGFHVIQVLSKEPEKTRRLEDVREEIVRTLRLEKSRQRAESEAAKVKQSFASADKKRSFQDLSKDVSAEYKVTAWFFRGKAIAGIPSWQAVATAALNLKGGEVSAPVPAPEGIYLLRVLERKESRIPPFEEVQRDVEKALVRKEAREQTAQEAREVSAKILAGADVQTAAKGRNAHLEKLEAMSRGEFLRKFPALRGNLGDVRRVFGAKLGSPVQVEGADGTQLFVVLSRQTPDEKDYQKGRAEIYARLTEQRRQTIPQVYLSRLLEKAKILRTPGAV